MLVLNEQRSPVLVSIASDSERRLPEFTDLDQVRAGIAFLVVNLDRLLFVRQKALDWRSFRNRSRRNFGGILFLQTRTGPFVFHGDILLGHRSLRPLLLVHPFILCGLLSLLWFLGLLRSVAVEVALVLFGAFDRVSGLDHGFLLLAELLVVVVHDGDEDVEGDIRVAQYRFVLSNQQLSKSIFNKKANQFEMELSNFFLTKCKDKIENKFGK